MDPITKIKQDMIGNPEWQEVYFMDFVFDFRRYRDTSFLQEPFTLDNERIDALLASTVEYLCDEIGLEIPEWIEEVPGCKDPWFVSENENMKAIAIVESPLRFRMRKIFVLEDFLRRF